MKTIVVTGLKTKLDVSNTLKWMESNTNLKWEDGKAPTKYSGWRDYFTDKFYLVYENKINFTNNLVYIRNEYKEIDFKDLISSKQQKVTKKCKIKSKTNLSETLENEINQNEEFLKMKVIQLGDECESYVKEKEKLRGLLTERDIKINQLESYLKDMKTEELELKKYINNGLIGNTILFTITILLSFALYIKW